MNKKILFAVIFLLINSSLLAQTFISNIETSFGSDKADFYSDINRGDNGNVVTTGFFCSTVDFDPGPGVFNITSNGTALPVNTTYGANQFVQKFNPSGALMWAVANVTGEMRSLSTQIVPEVDVDAAGNVFVSTKVYDSLDVDPGPAVLNMPAPRISYTGMGMIQKLDAATGALLWAIPIDADFKMQVDNNGDVLIAGSYGDSVDLDPGSGTFWMDPLANNSTAPFAAKYSGVDGSFMWGADFDFSSTYTIIRDIDVSSSNRLMLCGSFRNTIDVNPDPNITTLYNGSNQIYNQGFMIMLNADGTFYTARDYSYNNGSNLSTNSFSCAFDDLDNYYVSTTIPGSGGTSPVNAFIKYSPLNYPQWTEDLSISSYSMECKGNGEIYFEGRLLTGVSDIDPSSNIVAPNNSTISHLIMKWDGSSNSPSIGPSLDWYKVIDKDFQNYNFERFYMDVDDNDGLYIAATYADNLTPNLGSTNTYSVVTCNPNQPSTCYDMYLNFAQICESTTTYDSAWICAGLDYTFPDGSIQTINAATDYTSTIQSSTGCDSIIETHVALDIEMAISASFNNCLVDYNRIRVIVTDMGTVNGQISPAFDMMIDGTTINIAGPGTYYFITSIDDASYRAFIFSNNCHPDITVYNNCYQGTNYCATSSAQLIQNSNFENTVTVAWTEFATFLDSTTNTNNGVISGSNGGTYNDSPLSAKFGGYSQGSYHAITHTFFISPNETSELSWYQRQTGACDAGDLFEVKIDGQTIFSQTADQDPYCNGDSPMWTLKKFDITPYATGGVHQFEMFYEQLGTNGYTNLFVDDVRIYSCPCPVIAPTNITDTICFFDSYTFPDGNTFLWGDLPQDTIYESILDNGNGCDSLVYTNLHKRPNDVGAVMFPNVCFGSNYTYPDGFTHTNIQSNLGHASVLTNRYGCDSNQLQLLQVQPVYTFYDTTILCAGADYTAPDGTLYSNVQTTFDHTSSLSTAYGCDSTHQSNVKVLPSYTINTLDTICYNESYTFPDGVTLNSLQVDTLYVIPNTAQNGCDSSLMVDLYVRPNSQSANTTHAVCSGDDFTYQDGTTDINITTYTVHLNTFTNQFGCDSTFIQDVVVNPIYILNDTTVICQGSDYTAADGTFFGNVQASFNHTSNLTTQNSCDSIFVIQIEVLPSYAVSSNDTICYNESYTFPDGNTLNNLQNDTLYVSSYLTVNSCDSSILVNLYVRSQNAITNLSNSICSGGSYTYIDGNVSNNITIAESYTSILTDVNGCDSLVTENVGLNPSYVIQDSFDVCFGDDFTFADGTTLTISNNFTYTSNLTTANSCDSIFETTINAIGLSGVIQSSTAVPLSNSTVYLIEHLPGQDYLFIQDSTTTNANGEYSFDEGDANHFIKAIPSASFPNDLPSYYLSSTIFQYAVEADCSNNLNFTTIAGQNLGGLGFISGFIGDGAGKNSEIGNPLSGLALVLVDANGLAIEGVTTDANGYFIFEELLCGEYEIWLDDALTNNNLAPLITLADACIQENLQLVLKDNQLQTSSINSIGTILDKMDINLFPNPTDDKVFIDFNEKIENVVISVFDITGKLINQIDVAEVSRTEVELGQAKGAYFIEVLVSGNKYYFKVLKK